MTVARTVADVLTEHVVFDVECIDRMYLNVYQPKLQYAAGLVGYVQRQLGLPIASTAPLARITDRFTAAVHRFAETEGIEWVDFAKGQRKDDVMHEHLQRFTATQGVVFIGRAQEKTTVFRTEKRRHPDGVAYPWIVKTTGVINQFYFYCVDSDFGPFFLKFCSYFPYNAKLCINGHHWAQQQAGKAGIGFTAMDNAFADVADPAALQAICDRLGPAQIQALLDKWLAILPNPYTRADADAGYRYQLSILQAEFSLTQMLDNPVSGRVFFEQIIRDNLDIGRPDQVSLIFDRRLMKKGPRQTPGRFRTRVITDGVTPSLHADYKNATIKQYHKQGRALRTETTINNTRDFGIGKRLTNLPALREIGFHANRRLLRVQTLGHDPITGINALHTVTDPIITEKGTRVPGLRLGQLNRPGFRGGSDSTERWGHASTKEVPAGAAGAFCAVGRGGDGGGSVVDDERGGQAESDHGSGSFLTRSGAGSSRCTLTRVGVRGRQPRMLRRSRNWKRNFEKSSAPTRFSWQPQVSSRGS